MYQTVQVVKREVCAPRYAPPGGHKVRSLRPDPPSWRCAGLRSGPRGSELALGPSNAVQRHQTEQGAPDFRSLSRYRRQFRYLLIPISSANTDERMPQISRVWICPTCSDLIDRESRDLASRTGLFDDLSMTKTSIRAVTRDRALGCKVCFPNTVQLFLPRLKFGLDVLY